VGITFLAVALVSAAARLAVPVPGTVVPVTLQDLAVLVVGVVLGPARGAAAMATYVGLGAMGAPVFSGGHGGLAWLMGPTGGYLLSYPLACWVVGAAAAGRRPWPIVAAGVLTAQSLVFVGGVLQLLALTGQGLPAVMAQGVVPFLPGTAMKITLVLAFVAAMRWRASGPGSSGDARGEC
jgi:biotin transport system substrate-specific component